MSSSSAKTSLEITDRQQRKPHQDSVVNAVVISAEEADGGKAGCPMSFSLSLVPNVNHTESRQAKASDTDFGLRDFGFGLGFAGYESGVETDSDS